MKDFIKIALMAIMISFMLCGCEGNNLVQKGSNVNAKGSDINVHDSDMPKKVEIDVLMGLTRYHNEMKDYFQIFHDKVLADYNMDITINLEMMSSSNYMDELIKKIDSNEPPDVFTLPAGWKNLGDFNKGHLMSLTGQRFTEKLYRSIWEIAAEDEELYALPFEVEAYGVLYNKDIFERCNLKFPETFEELIQAVNVLERNGYTAFELTLTEDEEPSMLGELLLELTAGNIIGGEGLRQEIRESDEDGAELSEIYRIIDFIYAHSRKDADYRNKTQGIINYSGGSAAMWVQDTHTAKRIQLANPSIRLGFAALPLSDNRNSNRIKLEGITSLAISAHTDEKEAAMLLMEFMLDDKESSAFFDMLQLNPVADIHNYELPEWMEEVRTYVIKGRTRSRLCLPEAVKSAVGKLLKSYYVNDIDREELISLIERIFN